VLALATETPDDAEPDERHQRLFALAIRADYEITDGGHLTAVDDSQKQRNERTQPWISGGFVEGRITKTPGGGTVSLVGNAGPFNRTMP